jgi:hypothetical protein
VSRRTSLGQKSNSNAKSMTSAPARRSRLFGQLLLLEGEDPAAYEELLARLYAAIKPVDVIDEIFIDDMISLQWDVLRWRRSKSCLIRADGLEALERFLAKKLDYNLYSKYFAEELAEILQDNLPENQAKEAEMLARACAHNDADAVTRVNKVLDNIDLSMDSILKRAQVRKAGEILHQFARREPAAVVLVKELVASANESIDGFMANALAINLDRIERIDRLATIAENRRNVSLREIERRRALVGESRPSQEIESDEHEVIELRPAEGND